MTLQRNRVLALLIGLALALSSLVSSPANADARQQSVAKAADWIARQWDSSSSSSAGTLADAVIALSAADAHPDVVAEMLWELHELTPGYIGTPDARPNPSAQAKIVMALDAANQDPRKFLPGRDLVQELVDYAEADGANVKSFFAPHLIAIALSRSGEAVPGNIVDAMTGNQDGGAFGYRIGTRFQADPDYTAMGISAMRLIGGSALNPASVREAANASLQAAIAWTEDPQNRNTDEHGNHYWSTYSAANSTGLIASALAEAGEDVEAPTNYLVHQQLADGSWGAAHNATKGNYMATTQALLGPAGKGYGTIGSTQVAPINFTGEEEPEPQPGESEWPASHVGPCVDDEGVTVVVDFQGLGGDPLVRCATFDPDNGVDALRGAGFTMQGVDRWGDQFVCRINDRPAADEVIPVDGDPTYTEACRNTPLPWAYWSYWQSADEGETWEYATMGAMSQDPEPGGWEGWSFSLNATSGTNPEPRTELALSLLEPAPVPTPSPSPDPDPSPTPDPDPTPGPDPTPDPDEPADVTAAIAAVTIQGRDANAWGTVDGKARVSTQVRLPDGRWSTSQTRSTGDDGAFVIPLTYGKDSAGTLRWRVRVVHDDGTVQLSEPMVQTRLARTTSAVAQRTVAGRDANLWGNVAGPATISTQVRLPDGRWSTSQTRKSTGGFYAISLTYGRDNAATLQWRVRVVHENGMVEHGPLLTQQRVQRPIAATAGSKLVGQDTYTWGRVDVDRPTRVFTQVFADGAWSRSQVSRTTASGGFTVELTYGKHRGGTYRYRVGADYPGIGTVYSDEFVLVRTIR